MEVSARAVVRRALRHPASDKRQVAHPRLQSTADQYITKKTFASAASAGGTFSCVCEMPYTVRADADLQRSSSPVTMNWLERPDMPHAHLEGSIPWSIVGDADRYAGMRWLTGYKLPNVL